jgi:hypothetical protein
MDHALSRILTTSALVVFAGVLSIVACTHTTDRVVEPVGGADASTTSPEVGDSGGNPIGPIANPIDKEPREDFRLVRAPEFGMARNLELVSASPADRQGGGLAGMGGAAGFGGSDARPVSSCGGGTSYY